MDSNEDEAPSATSSGGSADARRRSGQADRRRVQTQGRGGKLPLSCAEDTAREHEVDDEPEPISSSPGTVVDSGSEGSGPPRQRHANQRNQRAGTKPARKSSRASAAQAADRIRAQQKGGSSVDDEGEEEDEESALDGSAHESSSSGHDAGSDDEDSASEPEPEEQQEQQGGNRPRCAGMRCNRVRWRKRTCHV